LNNNGTDCMVNECYGQEDTCRQKDNCVVVNNNCVPFTYEYCLNLTNENKPCDLSYCVEIDKICRENVCRKYNTDGCELHESCVIDVDGRCVSYYSQFCGKFGPSSCKSRHCVVSNGECVDNYCFVDPYCDLRDDCVIDEDGICTPMPPDYCSKHKEDDCADHRCAIISHLCTSHNCSRLKADDGCTFPCVLNERDNSSCVVSNCTHFTTNTCLSQFIEYKQVCKINGSECVPETRSDQCAVFEEDVCEEKPVCFWNGGLLSVLKCDVVKKNYYCNESHTAKECGLAEEGLSPV
jgi:hypothetical protein